jgi:putative endonuclease
MAEHNELGKQGEAIAAQHLQEKGYRILAKNWRFAKAELDLVVQTENTLVVVEVKTRNTGFFGEPELAVSKRKQQQLVKAAHAFMEAANIDLEVRFDVVGIISNKNKTELNHVEEAFQPRWR